MTHFFPSAAAWRRSLLALTLSTAATFAAQAQNNVGVGTTSPHASAALDVSSTSQGLLAPRLTAAQRAAIASPATGLLVYQTDATAGFYVYSGSAWTAIGAAGTTGTTGPQGPIGNTGPTGVAGAQGPIGNTGPQGPIGNTGATGNTGLTGNTGPQGPQGTAGTTGAQGPQGTAGSNGTNGTNGQGVPTGGTAGQVLSKVDGTDYSTQWSTPTGGGASLQLRANKVGGTGETLPTSVSTTAPTIAFNNVLTSPTLGTWDGTTYTVGSNGAGTYIIQAAVLGPDGSPTNNTVSYSLLVEVNNAGYGSTGGNVYYGIYTALDVYTPAGTKARGELSKVVYMSAGDTFKIRGIGTNSSVAAPTISTVAGSNITVVKLN